MRLIVIRHGETEWNIQHRYQGQLDSPLTEKGRRQAEAIAHRLADVSFDRLVSSDLGRAVDTAKAIARQHPGLPWEQDAGLRERNFGMLAGYTRDEAAKEFPREEEGYLHGGVDYRIPEGESLRDVFHRAGRTFDQLAERCAGETVCVITHGGILGMFLRHAVGIPVEHTRCYKFVNAAYNEFTWEQGHWLLHVWGDISHLGDIGAMDDL
ncbi:histidine phosphatase family protein [Cerasicoccus arenae]|uniref:Phosphoglycerate mutase n=1 Tax=Cerasicoccus arenae TaxID=424488 RepID=A0A8J3DFB9_9BACT|nr:histidine phosphatase family protein [Cerasicoccus arenae]MBK1858991.1 histidine phosphatase family protein [Cerasicoccus arenae]GHB94559.1 phosphoglycerate mutase [Cerasicoccus arenae]